MSHRYHPDPEKDDPPSALLFDDCERCDAQAKDPRHLDDFKLAGADARAQDDNWSGTKNEYRLFEFLDIQWCINQRLGTMGML